MHFVIAKSNDVGSPIPEWFVIELQGTLESSHSGATFIGDLHLTNKGDAIFIVGHHVLYGKETKLEKSFAVLKKTLSNKDEILIDDDNKREDQPYYECTALIKRKLLFKIRPKPIVVAKKV